MKRTQVTCGNCGGLGRVDSWNVVHEDIPDHDIGIITGNIEIETVTCKQCGGMGYIEYAMFSVEEATAILKHCGLEEV